MKSKLYSMRLGLKLGLLGLACLLAIIIYYFRFKAYSPIKIGILHSLTGSLAISEKAIANAELMAIDEINAHGGINKRKIMPIIVDGKSDENVFAREAERLIKEEKVAAIIGCWTSASRKMVKDVVEKYDNLLIYPVAFEGVEESPNILYTGTTQNQQVIPAALWSFYNLGTKFFLIGSEEIYSHVLHAIIKDALASVGAQIADERYIPLSESNVDSVIDAILAAKPDVIINSIEGEINATFFKGLRAKGITPEKIPVMSIAGINETEVASLGAGAMAGDYLIASYFQSLESEQNTAFVARFKKKYGAESMVSESCEAGYIGIHIWAQALRHAGSIDMKVLRNHLHNRVFNAPEGIVYTDNISLNMWKMIYVGRLRSDGQFTIVWDSKKTIQPLNFPLFKPKSVWEKFINDLYESWGKRWSKIAG